LCLPAESNYYLFLKVYPALYFYERYKQILLASVRNRKVVSGTFPFDQLKQ